MSMPELPGLLFEIRGPKRLTIPTAPMGHSHPSPQATLTKEFDNSRRGSSPRCSKIDEQILTLAAD